MEFLTINSLQEYLASVQILVEVEDTGTKIYFNEQQPMRRQWYRRGFEVPECDWCATTAPASLTTNTRPHASMLRPWCQCSTASHSSDVLLPLCLCLVNDRIFEDWWWKTLRQNCIILAVSASIGVQYYSSKVNFNKIDSEQYWAYEWPWSLIWLLVNINLLTLH